MPDVQDSHPVTNMLLKLMVVLGLVAISRASKALEYASSRIKRNVLFPSGSGMGIYLALALPLDLPEYEISMSFNYEANYVLPTNATELALGPQYTEIRKARSITREKVYSYIEDNMKNGGLLGKPCLLRTICETQANPVFGHNGLIGDLIHILFTPSTTSPEGLSDDYSKAEEEGVKGKENCARMYGDCPIDLVKPTYKNILKVYKTSTLTSLTRYNNFGPISQVRQMVRNAGQMITSRESLVRVYIFIIINCLFIMIKIMY